jgi:hypothetical protein
MDTVNVLFMIPGLLPSLQMGCCHLLPEQSGVNDCQQPSYRFSAGFGDHPTTNHIKWKTGCLKP